MSDDQIVAELQNLSRQLAYLNPVAYRRFVSDLSRSLNVSEHEMNLAVTNWMLANHPLYASRTDGEQRRV